VTSTRRITPCFWFDTQAEDAARFYTGIFKNSKITATSRYGEEGREIHQQPPGSVMAVHFEINGQPFTALNGGPQFKFNESISFQVNCDTQEEIDHYWEKLSAGADKNSQQCGSLKDQFGVSWQVVPPILPELLGGKDHAGAQRAMKAMLQMKKLDIAKLKQAYAG
jgi:predicted 3-demethylubiquinone-9 3-methyltransferase (glyoxalase superfamily)